MDLKRESAPCRDCKDRAVGCHARCALYAEWKERDTAQREAIWKAKQEDRIGDMTASGERRWHRRIIDRKDGRKV